jgi:hypothetical protein
MERVKGIELSSQDSEAHLNQSEIALWTARRFHPAASAAIAGDLVFETIFGGFCVGHPIHKKNPPHADSVPTRHSRAALTACRSRPAIILLRHIGCRFTSARMLVPMNSCKAKASFFFSN